MLTILFFALSCQVFRFSWIVLFFLVQIMHKGIRRLYIFAEKVEISKGNRDKQLFVQDS